MTLLDLAEQHRGAFEYDWRARFHLPFDLPGEMTWGEIWRLTQILAADPSSCLAASLGGWGHPVTREWIVAADAYDAFVSANSDPKKTKPKTYPRPWDKPSRPLGQGTSMTVAEYRAMRAAIEAA